VKGVPGHLWTTARQLRTLLDDLDKDDTAEPLLFVGDDCIHTDVTSALPG